MAIGFLHFLFLYLPSSQIWLNPDHHFLTTGKTSNKICNVFRGMLIECNNLQGTSENKMLAPMGIPFYEMPLVVSFTMTSVNPVHNAPVPPPCGRYLLRTGSNLSSCTVVVNAPQSC
jgi:hypothetical protein